MFKTRIHATDNDRNTYGRHVYSLSDQAKSFYFTLIFRIYIDYMLPNS